MKCRKQKRRDMYQIREFPQAALKETLALEFRANCVETQNMCSISQMTSRVEEEKNWLSPLLLAENSNSVICCLLEIFGKADRTQFYPLSMLHFCAFFKNEDSSCSIKHLAVRRRNLEKLRSFTNNDGKKLSNRRVPKFNSQQFK